MSLPVANPRSRSFGFPMQVLPCKLPINNTVIRAKITNIYYLGGLATKEHEKARKGLATNGTNERKIKLIRVIRVIHG
jgi:hypothetical protein